MNYSFLPDLLALTILIVILLLLRRRHPQGRADIWLLGLFFTLVEAVAHTFYPMSGPLPKSLHLIVMDCYLLGGVVFGRRADTPSPRGSSCSIYRLIPLPLLAITTLYGLHIYSAVAFFACMAVGSGDRRCEFALPAPQLEIRCVARLRLADDGVSDPPRQLSDGGVLEPLLRVHYCGGQLSAPPGA